ncbi:hypothetical protein [Tritonibacter scottomollicae]|uniref:hypothetical protein n=1 Tax=Tritonibacter scottomollicae TaxID=483013 RepID=UPI002943E54F|nr:hypothetical protein [Tritonibacter scottomollicae]
MPTLKIDLSTRILSDDMKVFLVHPGARYVFHNTVLEHSVLPADVPFLSIDNGKGVPEADDIGPMLERARQMRKWAKRPLADENRPRPIMDLDFYRVGLEAEAGAQGARTKLRNSAQKILWSIPEKSLIVVPSQRITEHALIAEAGPREADRQKVAGIDQYHGMEFLARPLIGVKKVPMLKLPASVVASARSTSIVEEVDGHAEDQLLRLYYGDYQRDSEYVAGVIANTDDFDSMVLGQMIDLHVAIQHFLETGVALEPGRALYDKNVEKAPRLHATINSPDGRASLESSGIATFAVKLLMIVAASGVALTDAGNLIANADVILENSAQQMVDPALMTASAHALVDFFATSGYSNYNEYLEALQNGLERNATTPTGTAVIQP